MFCTECGARLPEKADNCAACGARVDGAGAGVTTSPPPPHVGAAPSGQLSFGDWRVDPQAVFSSSGVIPLDEVSACVFEQTPRNMVLLLMGAAVVLTGLMLMVNHNMPMGIVALAIGGLMLFLGLKSKSNFRLYSTSGHFFACEAVEIDLSGNRKREFDGFCSGLVAARHRYITARSGGA